MPEKSSLTCHLINALKEQGSYVLASPKDAEYYRKTFQQKKSLPSLPKFSNEHASPEEKPTPQKTDPSSGFSIVRQIVKTAVPELKILDEIPDDGIAKKISERWKTKNQSAPISLLVFQEPPEQRSFLEQIIKALDIYFGPAKMIFAEEIEKQKQWDSFLSSPELKLILICDYTLWQLHSLLQFYQEVPAKGERRLGNTPLFLLPDLSLYLKDPLLKRSLWKALCLNLN